jgi:hypothetical protein
MISLKLINLGLLFVLSFLSPVLSWGSAASDYPPIAAVRVDRASKQMEVSYGEQRGGHLWIPTMEISHKPACPGVWQWFTFDRKSQRPRQVLKRYRELFMLGAGMEEREGEGE